MSSEYDRLIMDTEKQEEIQLIDHEKTSEIQASTRHVAETKVEAFKNVAGVTEDKQLLDELEAIEINVSGVQEKYRSKQSYTRIQKAPEIVLRNGDFKEYFKPMELSIGPIYAADSNLFKRELKLRLAAHFIERSGSAGEVLLEEIKNSIFEIKAYFHEEVIKFYTKEELFRLVFLDGCAMLGFIDSYVNQRLNMFDISNGQAALIRQDLFLLENQIPFRVLEVLMRRSTRTWKEDFLRFVLMSNIISPRDCRKLLHICFTRFFSQVTKKPVHILDLLRRLLLIDTNSYYQFENNTLHLTWDFFWLFCSCGAVALACCVMERLRKSRELPEYWSKKQSFRNVQELKTAGIEFKPTCDCLTTISFDSLSFISGQLMLPTLVVDNSTARKLFNLVAYEMCLPDHPTNSSVTSYVNLLDLLIDNEQDVKDLRAADVLRNCLSSDIEVAKLINSIGSNCFAPPIDTYAGVKNKIEKHYRRQCAIWMAQVCHAHFSSPWTILALFAASAILILTATQTWYAVIPKK